MIRCAHCTGRHETVGQVRLCSQVKSAVAVLDKPLPTLDSAAIEAKMHAAVQASEAAEDRVVAQFKADRDAALLGIGPVCVKKSTTVTEPGMYKNADGTVYLVKYNSSKTRLYACRLVPTYQGTKLHRLDFAYDKGAIYGLTAADRMTVAEVAALGKLTGRCWVCRHELKVAKSIAAGIGPVCAKKV